MFVWLFRTRYSSAGHVFYNRNCAILTAGTSGSLTLTDCLAVMELWLISTRYSATEHVLANFRKN